MLEKRIECFERNSNDTKDNILFCMFGEVESPDEVLLHGLEFTYKGINGEIQLKGNNEVLVTINGQDSIIDDAILYHMFNEHIQDFVFGDKEYKEFIDYELQILLFQMIKELRIL